MTDESVQVVNKPAFLEVSDGEVLISIATNILIELYPTSPVVTKDSYYGACTYLPHFQHQIDLLRQELEKTLLQVMILKTSSIKN